MKKLLTLVLCWLLAFEAFGATTFKARTSVSVAGGYVTSLNKVDGSFEDGSTQWSASVGTIVPTASTEFQGNYKGVWSGTGTGTLDLQWTATASNTFEASAQVNVKGEDDVYVCAYVGTIETGCKLIPALNKIQKVSVVADSILSSAFNLRLKHTGSDAFSVDVDDGKIEPWTPQAVNLVEQESVSFKGTGLLTTTGTIRFPTSGFSKQWLNLATYSESTGRLTAKKKATFSGGISLLVSSVAQKFYLYKNGTLVNVSNNTPNAADYMATVPFSIELNPGDYLTVETDGGVNITQNVANSFSITATAISENVVQSWQDGMATWSATSTIQIGATTTAPTKGTTDLDQVKWIKRGESAEFWYQYNQTGAGSAGSGDYLFSLPNGMQFADHVTKFTNLEGSGDWNTKNTIPAGAIYQSSFVGSVYIIPYDSTRFRLGYIGGTTSNTTSMGVLGSAAGALSNVNTSFSLKFTAPINGFSNAPTLLALPASKINDYSATISNNGSTASINSVGSDWIQGVSRDSAGIVTVTFKTGIFTVAPAIKITALNAGSNLTNGQAYSALTANSVKVHTSYNYGGTTTLVDVGFTIEASKQSPDYTAPGVFVGSLAKDYTAYVDASEAITNATDNFITSCTNADPTVCTFATNKFGTPPYCNAQKTSSADVYVTTTSTTSVTIERADASSPFSLFCQIK